MIVRLRGVLLEKAEEGAVLDVGGVGYAVAMSPSALLRLPPPGEEVVLYVVESVAMYGGGVTLYGFLDPGEKQIFDVLRGHIPGTGAKKAMEMLDKAAKSLPDFRRAVLDKDVKALVSLFGFTPKTAEKMVAALQGKLDAVPVLRAAGGAAGVSAFEETVQGLVSLGYKEPAARQAAQSARSALGSAAPAQDLIRESLRHLSGRG